MGQPPQYFITQMPPQHAGETSSPVGQAGRAGEPSAEGEGAGVRQTRWGRARTNAVGGEKAAVADKRPGDHLGRDQGPVAPRAAVYRLLAVLRHG